MFLPSRHYESEHTKFIRELIAKKPQIIAEQKASRAIWWDKPPREVELERKMDREGGVPQAPYVYQS